MERIYKLPLILDPQPEGGYTITCPLIPELITEADALDEVNPHVLDALKSIINAYTILGRPLPAVLRPLAPDVPIWSDTLVTLEIE
jgi:antitoxin HicB